MEILAALVMLIIVVAIIGAMGSGIWKAFAKAGKPGWSGIVPFYSNIVMAEIAGKPVWWGCLCWIPYLGIIPYIVLCSAISKKFGKGIEMTICLSFGFGWIILGWGRARYSDDLEVAKNLEKQGITTCVWCLEEVKFGARVCKHCGKNPLEEVEAWLQHEAEEKANKAAADKMEGELIRKREEEIEVKGSQRRQQESHEERKKIFAEAKKDAELKKQHKSNIMVAIAGIFVGGMIGYGAWHYFNKPLSDFGRLLFVIMGGFFIPWVVFEMYFWVKDTDADSTGNGSGKSRVKKPQRSCSKCGKAMFKTPHGNWVCENC